MNTKLSLFILSFLFMTFEARGPIDKLAHNLMGALKGLVESRFKKTQEAGLKKEDIVALAKGMIEAKKDEIQEQVNFLQKDHKDQNIKKVAAQIIAMYVAQNINPHVPPMPRDLILAIIQAFDEYTKEYNPNRKSNNK